MSYSVALDEHTSDGALDMMGNNASDVEKPSPAPETDGSQWQNHSPDDKLPSPRSSWIDGYVSLSRSDVAAVGRSTSCWKFISPAPPNPLL
ncbi:hypothetical protein H4R33_000327 [Dimargaris cristalligena]|nr:hypothetical protein H4R33_000327 [Dimargaris cristalligena]